MRKTELATGRVERRRVLDARAENTRFYNGDGRCTERAGYGSFQTEALELAPFFTPCLL